MCLDRRNWRWKCTNADKTQWDSRKQISCVGLFFFEVSVTPKYDKKRLNLFTLLYYGMIEASEILDLTDGNSAERSNDDQHAHGAILGSGHPLLPGRQTTQNISSLVSIHDIEEMTPNDEQNGIKYLFLCL